MKLANPLYYPVAVLSGGVVLFAGVRFLNLPSALMLPVSAAVAVAGAATLKSREPEVLNLNNPGLERELQSVRQQARVLADKAISLQVEAGKLLIDSLDMELLVAVQYSCDRAAELPIKLDEMVLRLQGDDSLLSPQELQRQLDEVQAKISRSSGAAKTQLIELSKSLCRNIQLARQGEDARQAQIISLSTVIQDSAGVLQQLQNKLRTSDLTNSEQTRELRELSENFRSFQESVDLLVS
ncbi:hypothetical protein QUB63_08155 [Microcoleus sp. ARI1-B5]|uniref:hypothetical protein n=1 Tax=unclassified Microcoleus TaxID=2642155 RepID=UPI002FD2ACA1